MLGPLVDTVVICFMTGLIIVVTGTWKEKYPDQVPFTRQSSITVIKSDGKVVENGKVPDSALFSGTFLVKSGKPVGVRLVRNNSVIDDVRLLVSDTPFTGKVVVSNGRTEIRDTQGRVVPNSDCVVKGRMLLNGSPLTAMAFEKGLAPVIPFGNYLVTIAVFLFALSTAISWSYYGDRAVLYLFGPKAVFPYKVLFTVVHFLGAIFSLELVWAFGDAALGMMAIPNLIAIIILGGRVRKASDDYFARMKTGGTKA
jgi:AGCS family alanine or glycine:cation symporter